MKLNFLKPIEETDNFLELIGKTEEDVQKMEEDFNKAVSSGKITNSAELIVWCADRANTIEEALIYSAISLRAISEG